MHRRCCIPASSTECGLLRRGTLIQAWVSKVYATAGVLSSRTRVSSMYVCQYPASESARDAIMLSLRMFVKAITIALR